MYLVLGPNLLVYLNQRFNWAFLIASHIHLSSIHIFDLFSGTTRLIANIWPTNHDVKEITCEYTKFHSLLNNKNNSKMWKKIVVFDVFKLFSNTKGEICSQLVIHCRFLIVKMVLSNISNQIDWYIQFNKTLKSLSCDVVS